MDNDKFESLSTYLLIAKKIISKFASKFYSSLAKEMLQSEDAIGNVANAIMRADEKWSPDYKSKNNTVRSKHSLRHQYAIWAIIKYIKEKKRYITHLSLSYQPYNIPDEYGELSGIMEDKKSPNPIDELILKDNKQYYAYSLDKLLHSKVLTRCQAKYIRGYYLEEKTLQEVGNTHSVSREAVRQGILKGLTSLRSIV